MGDLRREYVPWLKILNHFCDQSVIAEYNYLTKIESKMKLLDCLKSVLTSMSASNEMARSASPSTGNFYIQIVFIEL